MESKASTESPSLIWLFLLLVALLLILIFWVIWGANGQNDRPTGLLTPTTPVAAGAIIPLNPTFQKFAEASIEITAANSPATLTLAEQSPSDFQPNQTVIVSNLATFGSAGQLSLFADIYMSAPVLNVYPSGTELLVLEPTGDYSTYPVEQGGISWLRVRDGAGLIGWANREMFQPAAPLETVGITTSENSGTSAPGAVNAVQSEPVQAAATPMDTPTVMPTLAPDATPTLTSTPAG